MKEAEQLRALFDEEWHFWMVEHPEIATAMGYPGQNARWTDYSAAAIDRRIEYLNKSAKRLSAIDRAGLDAGDRLNADLYRDLLDTAVEGLAFGNLAMPIRGVTPPNLLMPMNQIEGIQHEIGRTIAMTPAATRGDLEDIVSRLEGVGRLVDQTIALMERGLASGVTPPKITLRNLAAQAEGQIVGDPLESPLLSAFTGSSWPTSMSEADRVDLTARASDAYRRVVSPAFARLAEFVATRYVPACRESIGASDLPNGNAWYAYNVRWHTTTDLTPKQIHEIGVGEVKRIHAEMDAVIASTGFKGSKAEFAEFLRTDKRFYFADADSLLAAYRDIAKRADPQMARLFGRLPQTPYGVLPVPDALAPSQTTAYYEPGAFTAGRPANMFANTYKLASRPKWEMAALTLHEAVPGHHLQISIAQELTELPEFRKNSSYTGYVEGWGLYSESLGDEMGFYADPYSKFGQLTYEMWRAIRLVLDTGLHAMNWPRDRAIEYFRLNSAKTEQDIIVEVDRYIVWPGQALGYKIGQLKLRELRTKAERALASKFDIRPFHDALLEQGALPLDVLERHVDAWIASRQL